MSDLHTLNKWRSWRTGLTWEDAALGVKLIGALDDCLVDYPYTKDPKAEIYMPLDNKTKGSNPKDNGAQYYQLQLDCYGLLLQTNGYKTNNKAFLAYYYPLTTQLENVNPGETALRFGITTFCLESSPDRAVNEITRAVEILKDKRPTANPGCEWCKFGLMDSRKE